MKLTQKRPLLVQMEYEIGETALKISAQNRFSGTTFEIPFASIRPDIATVRKFPIAQLIKSAVLLGLAALFVVPMVHLTRSTTATGDFKEGSLLFWGLLSFLLFSFGIAELFRFYVRNIDCFVVHTRRANPVLNSGRRSGPGRVSLTQNLIIHRSIPNERHVTEFIEILKEKIAEAKFQNPPSPF